MILSKQSISTLVDLVEIKLGCMEVHDREDARELTALENCREQLLALKAGHGENQVVAFPQSGSRPDDPGAKTAI